MRICTYFFILSVLGLLFFSCKKFEYSPYMSEKEHSDLPTELNNKNILKLNGQTGGDDTVTIIFSGDSQRFYDRLHSLVDKINTLPNIDFFVLSGDIADFGLHEEYVWIYRELKRLNLPYLCAIGNHDLAADNGEAFDKIFGDKNFSFVYKEHKFIFHDTNGREYAFNGKVPDMPWLKNQLTDSTARYFVGVSHVPPFDADFDKTLEKPYKNLFASYPNFMLSLHGHRHDKSDSYYYEDHVRYFTSNGVQKNEVFLLKLIKGQIIKQLISY